jgi:hypothetical protein
MSWKDRLVLAGSAAVIVTALVRQPWPVGAVIMPWGAATGLAGGLAGVLLEPLRRRGTAARIMAGILLICALIVPTLLLAIAGVGLR